MAANLETWLAEENSIVQKSENEKQVYLYDWLDRLIDHLKGGNLSNVSYSLFLNNDVNQVCIQ